VEERAVGKSVHCVHRCFFLSMFSVTTRPTERSNLDESEVQPSLRAQTPKSWFSHTGLAPEVFGPVQHFSSLPAYLASTGRIAGSGP
jgi:hypothetical protein